MYSKIYSGAIYGIGGHLVGVEADASDGFPSYVLVGYLASEVKEARERVTTALKNSGFHLPPKKIIVNLSPADLRKQGTAYDVPIALSVLLAIGMLPQDTCSEPVFAIGELGLNGHVLPVRGILPLLMCAHEHGIRHCIVPLSNLKEAQLVQGVEAVGVPDLAAACLYLSGDVTGYEHYMNAWSRRVGDETDISGKLNGPAWNPGTEALDFSDLADQEELKRAMTIAAGGMHHLLMIGPPGCGKSMAAWRLPGILPEMTPGEQLEVSRIYSVAGLLDSSQGLIRRRPCRSPHHTVPIKTMTGGGTIPVPGEITLAHRGVLFLDELAEFSPATLEVLRQPLEERHITLNRLYASFDFPAAFMLVAAMNPCRCGFFPTEKCHCSGSDVRRYLHRISRPLLDRMDLFVRVDAPDLTHTGVMDAICTDSETMRQAVFRARAMQQARYGADSELVNAHLDPKMIRQYCTLSREMQSYLDRLTRQYELSARVRQKVLKVARTIADLEGEAQIRADYLAEAVSFRMAVQDFWKAGEPV